MKIKKSIYKMSSSERITELKIDSTLWATSAKIINLLDFDPKKKVSIRNLIVLVIHETRVLKIL